MDDDIEDPFGEEVKAEFTGLNESFQNVFVNPNISLRGEATKCIDKISKFFQSTPTWPKIMSFIAAETDKLEEFTPVVKGIAGGIKIAGKQVFIKICMPSPSLLDYKDYAHAAKVAGHDLKGAGAVLSCLQSGLHVPLMSIVDYKGYRALVMTKVPIGDDTINTTENMNDFIEKNKEKLADLTRQHEDAKNRQDSNLADMLATQKKSVEELIAKKKRVLNFAVDYERFSNVIGEKLSLQKHTVNLSGETWRNIYFPFDMELYLGSDGRFYAIDLSRLLPPIYEDSLEKEELWYMYRLFRPEFMRKYAVRLSSDAFNRNSEVNHFPETKDATRHLQNELIKTTASVFTDQDQKDAGTLKQFMHNNGINMRYLGLFLYYLQAQTKGNSKIEGKVLQIEMVARAYTHIINTTMRTVKIKLIRNANLVDKFNDIINYDCGGYLNQELQDQFKKMYTRHLLEGDPKNETNKLFDNSNADYWRSIIQKNRVAIVRRVSAMTGVGWPDELIDGLEKGSTLAFDANSLSFEPVQKTINVPVFPEIYRMNGDYVKALSWYSSEAKLKKRILGNNHLRVAIALSYLAEAYSYLSTKIDRNHAEVYFQEAIEIYKGARQNGKNVTLDYAVALERKAKYLMMYRDGIYWDTIKALLTEAEKLKKEAADTKELSNTISLHAWFAYLKGESETALSKYSLCVRLLQQSGYTNLLALAKANLGLAALTKANLESPDPKYEHVYNAKTLCENALHEIERKRHGDGGLTYVDLAHIAFIEDHLGKISLLLSAKPANVGKGGKAPYQPPAPPRDANTPPLSPPTPTVSGTGGNQPPAPPHDANTPPLSPPTPTASEPSAAEYRQKARWYFQNAYEYRLKAFGKDHYFTIVSSDHIAQMLLKDREIKKSYEFYVHALQTLRSRLGKYHASVGRLLHNIAIWCAYQQKSDRASEAQREAVYILQNAFGQKHPITKKANDAFEYYSNYGRDPTNAPTPMNHEGVLAPDLPDPASFTAAYEEEISSEASSPPTPIRSISPNPSNPSIPPIPSIPIPSNRTTSNSSDPEQNDPSYSYSSPKPNLSQIEGLQTFRQLLLNIGYHENEPSTVVDVQFIKEIYKALESDETGQIKQTKRFSKQSSLPIDQTRTRLTRRPHTYSPNAMRKLKADKPPAPFILKESDLLRGLVPAQITPAVAVGGAVTSSPHRDHGIESGIKLDEKNAAVGRQEAHAVVEAHDEEEEIEEDEFEEGEVEQHPIQEAPLDIEKVSEEMDLLLQRLSRRKWDDLVHAARENLHTNRLLRLVNPSPYAANFD